MADCWPAYWFWLSTGRHLIKLSAYDIGDPPLGWPLAR